MISSSSLSKALVCGAIAAACFVAQAAAGLLGATAFGLGAEIAGLAALAAAGWFLLRVRAVVMQLNEGQLLFPSRDDVDVPEAFDGAIVALVFSASEA